MEFSSKLCKVCVKLCQIYVNVQYFYFVKKIKILIIKKFFVNIKMRYYWFNKQELLQKAKEKYDNGGKEKAAEYYQANKDATKEKAKNKYKNLTEEEK